MVYNEVTEPVALEIMDNGTRLAGATSYYEKRLDELVGVYSDVDAFNDLLRDEAEQIAYRVDESRLGHDDGALITGLSMLQSGRVGAEYYMTRGHMHVLINRAELYYCATGRGVVLMDNLNGLTKAIELTPGRAVHVPGGWVHRSVNVGPNVFSCIFCYPYDAGQDYEIVVRAGGMRNLVVTDYNDGWTLRPNPRHVGYKVILWTADKACSHVRLPRSYENATRNIFIFRSHQNYNASPRSLLISSRAFTTES